MGRRKPMSLDFDDAFGCMFAIVLVGGVVVGAAITVGVLTLVSR